MLFLWDFHSKNHYFIIQTFILLYIHPIRSYKIFLQLFWSWSCNSLQLSFFLIFITAIFYGFHSFYHLFSLLSLSLLLHHRYFCYCFHWFNNLFSLSFSVTSSLDSSFSSLPYGWTLQSATFFIYFHLPSQKHSLLYAILPSLVLSNSFYLCLDNKRSQHLYIFWY